MKKRQIFLPPIWLAVLLSIVGIAGMNLLYQSITDGGFTRGIIGGVLLVITIVLVGTPLAFARTLRKEAGRSRHQKH